MIPSNNPGDKSWLGFSPLRVPSDKPEVSRWGLGLTSLMRNEIVVSTSGRVLWLMKRILAGSKAEVDALMSKRYVAAGDLGEASVYVTGIFVALWFSSLPPVHRD